jgi:type II secretory pathway component PulM
MFDRLRDSWERLGARERRLLSLLGVVAVLVAVLYVGFMIQDGLASLERHNDDTRAVLATLESRREELIEAKSKQNEVVAMIGEEATALPSYLEKVGSELGVQIRAQQEKPTVTKGKFHEHSTEITLFDITLDQLARFLRNIETQSPVVVTTKLVVKRSSLQKEKLDRVQITVATYARPPRRAAERPAAPPAGEASP